MVADGGQYSKEHVVAHVYTVPWWVDSLGNGDYQNIFISSLIDPKEIAKILEEVKPDILSLYPTNLQALIPFLSEEVKNKLILAVVHSEMSSLKERKQMAQRLGVPVLDEYSSEELTRIALELPCGHYHLCEDTVRVDVVDPQTLKPIQKGTGLVIGTNLLNTAMPFIRYAQGDYVSVGEQSKCLINWRQIQKVEGRQNDAFIKEDGTIVPAGTVLDITYRWMFDVGINIQEFEIIQTGINKFEVRLNEPSLFDDLEKQRISFGHLRELLQIVFGENLDIVFKPLELKGDQKVQRKRRPIRREF